MEWMGWFCFILLMLYSSYPGKVTSLERKVARLERKQKGDVRMSQMIKDAIGKRCKFTQADNTQSTWIYTILDADDEWVKVTYTDKKQVSKTEIIRIDSIAKICLVSE